MTKGLCILGATGSIGRQCLSVVKNSAERFHVVALCAGKNVELLAQQTLEFAPKLVVVGNPDHIEPLRARLERLGAARTVQIASGVAGQIEAATHPSVDTVVSASHGTTGLVATYEAVRAGKRIGLANKEVLVAAGELVTRAVKEWGAELLPIDSEHCALHQCLRSGNREEVRRLILTASGGPFLKTTRKHLDRVTPGEALQHPIWKMGGRITIDSATLMNKGLEIIEARWLFGFPGDQIDVVIHPESAIHSMVEFMDGSVMAQMATPDMRLPISYALNYPDRVGMDGALPRLDLMALSKLRFAAPDTRRFPCLDLARQALCSGGSMPCALNAADEIAVEAFLTERLRFSDIPRVIEQVLGETTQARSFTSLEDVLSCDHEARGRAREVVTRLAHRVGSH
ncbi:1-deoxy-D-xylulose 5-phosphate reductoisomerase [Acidobacteriia bacterium SbA2]|nr:1-deoxy-D-xylulose 5-phosphate reductoisomerase [Acidobacteriia bacterium SbA2]